MEKVKVEQEEEREGTRDEESGNQRERRVATLSLNTRSLLSREQ